VENLGVAINRGGKKLSALDGVSFELYPAEILGIVGESGCGKSITALSLAGLLPGAAELTSGSIRFAGRELRGLPEGELRTIRGREISFIFQEPALSLNPLIKAGAQIAEALELEKKPGGRRDRAAIRERALRFMERLGLREAERIYDSYPHQLSGGMCQRVMIALALIRGPRLLIADEPTTALDVTIQAQILDLMRRVNRESGTGILFISHDLKVIRSISSRVLVMYAGKIVESGPVEEVFAHPRHEYTRGLIGSIPGRERKGKPLVNIPGKVPGIGERLPGCPFAPRCGRAERRCFEAFPPETIFPGAENPGALHRAHCIYPEPRPAEGEH
jgi:peptide/nickel transport system ATP-binding protein